MTVLIEGGKIKRGGSPGHVRRDDRAAAKEQRAGRYPVMIDPDSRSNRRMWTLLELLKAGFRFFRATQVRVGHSKAAISEGQLAKEERTQEMLGRK